MITYINASIKDSPCQVVTYITKGEAVSVIFHDENDRQWLEFVAGKSYYVGILTLNNWLKSLSENYTEWGIASLALPTQMTMAPIHLEQEVLKDYLGDIPDLEVFIYMKE